MTTRLASTAIAAALTLGIAAAAAAQAPKAGEVSRVEGTVAVARSATPDGMPLKVKDNVFVRDLVSTGQLSKAQLLLGGKATVTMREQSALRITEVPGVSTVEITSGTLKLVVAKDRMKAGERIDVKTPNAITAVRGTTIVTELVKAAAGLQTRLTVLDGFVDITPLNPATGAPAGPPVRVNTLQQTTVTGAGTPTPPQPINRADAVKMDATFAFKLSPATASDDVVKRQLEQAASDAAKLPSNAAPGKLPAGGDTVPNVSGDDIRSRTSPTAPSRPPGGRQISPGGS